MKKEHKILLIGIAAIVVLDTAYLIAAQTPPAIPPPIHPAYG